MKDVQVPSLVVNGPVGRFSVVAKVQDRQSRVRIRATSMERGNQSNSRGGPDPSDVIKILVATDIHLGYGEKHPVKAEDSFVTFDEILGIGVKESELKRNAQSQDKERNWVNLAIQKQGS